MIGRIACGLLLLIVCVIASGCAFLPGFGIFEDPALYAYSVSDVANQVSCEIQEFALEQIKQEREKEKEKKVGYKWVLDQGDVTVHLSLTTDNSGYVNFTGVNVAQIGLSSLASFVSLQSKVPTLGAKASAKRTRTAVFNFTVSPSPLNPNKNTLAKLPSNCDKFSLVNNAAEKLYMKEWLEHYFERINSDYENKPMPNQLKIQSVELSSALLLAFDISGGATPNLLGNGSTFVLPINGLSLDYNPDYTHKIDLTLGVCDNSRTIDSPKMPCFASKDSNTQLSRSLLDKQCSIYSYLVPLLTGVKPPKDIPVNDREHLVCDKNGNYVSKPIPPGNLLPTNSS